MENTPNPEFRSEFALAPELIYLNSGTHSVCPTAVLDAITRHQREYELNPTEGLFMAWSRLWKIQQKVARFFSADPADFILRPNVTLALNFFVLGMPLPAGSEILVSDLEYGAIVNLCRFRAERDRLKFRTLHLPASPEEIGRMKPAALVDLISGQISSETSLLLLSDVMTGTGLVLPVLDIAKETRRRGILLAIDGAHGPGFQPLDFSMYEDVDFYGGNLHKWMLGPKGTGFGWLPKRHQNTIHPVQAGWTTFETPAVFQGFGAGSRFASSSLMLGCNDFSPFFALSELLAFWKKHGREKILGRVVALQSFLEREVTQQLGWTPLSPSRESGLRGPLLSFELPQRLQGTGQDFMLRLLREAGVQVLVTEVHKKWAIRFSPHIYNTEDEIRRAVNAIARQCSI